RLRPAGRGDAPVSRLARPPRAPVRGRRAGRGADHDRLQLQRRPQGKVARMRASTGLVALCVAACNGDGDGHPGGTLDVTVDEGGVQDCAQPQARSAEGPYQAKATPVPRPTIPWIWHGGVTIADLDGDGYLDVLTALEQGVAVYLGTADGLFSEVG